MEKLTNLRNISNRKSGRNIGSGFICISYVYSQICLDLLLCISAPGVSKQLMRVKLEQAVSQDKPVLKAATKWNTCPKRSPIHIHRVITSNRFESVLQLHYPTWFKTATNTDRETSLQLTSKLSSVAMRACKLSWRTSIPEWRDNVASPAKCKMAC